MSVFSAVRHNGTARFSWARTLMKRPLTDKSIVDQRAKRARGYLFAVETLNGARPIISLRAILAHHQSAKAVRLSVSFFLCWINVCVLEVKRGGVSLDGWQERAVNLAVSFQNVQPTGKRESLRVVSECPTLASLCNDSQRHVGGKRRFQFQPEQTTPYTFRHIRKYEIGRAVHDAFVILCAVYWPKRNDSL